MKKWISAAVLALALCWSYASSGAGSRFIKVSDHCYYMPLKGSGENVAAVVTDEGVLLINPPAEPELTDVLEALKGLSAKGARWAIFTEPALEKNSGARFWAGQGPLLLAGAGQRALAASGAPDNPGGKAERIPSSWLVFDRQMRLMPPDLEIRIFALQNKARSGGDVAIFVPAEKVLFVGALYEAARYPDIDTGSGGSAVGWFDGMKQVIDAVPILKTAIPQAKPDPKPDKDKKPEEFIAVVSSRGDASNLQNMKDLLESCKKLRSDIARAVRQRRSCDDFLASPASGPYRSYNNLDSFAAQLFAETR